MSQRERDLPRALGYAERHNSQTNIDNRNQNFLIPPRDPSAHASLHEDQNRPISL